MLSNPLALRRDEHDIVHRLDIYAASSNTRMVMVCGVIIRSSYAAMNTHGRITCLRCASQE